MPLFSDLSRPLTGLVAEAGDGEFKAGGEDGALIGTATAHHQAEDTHP